MSLNFTMKSRRQHLPMLMQKTDFKILPFQPETLEAVVRIEQVSYPYPWSAAQFLQEAVNPVARFDLLWAGDKLAGYLCYWLIAGEMQILNVATAPEFRQRGVAGRLLEHAIVTCRTRGLESAWLEVRRGNTPAIALYQRLGFQQDGVRPGYYRDGEDALLMFRAFAAEKK